MSNKHKLILGASGTGKTYYAVSQAPEPFLFFNPAGEHPDIGRSFVRFDMNNERADFHDSDLKRIEYIPHYSKEHSEQELDLIVEELMESRREWTLVIDEAQRVAKPQGKAKAVEEALFRGRKHGLNVWMVSQSPRRLADDAVEQCMGGWILFELPYSKQYLKRKLGEMSDEFFQKMDGAQEYSFVEWDFREVSEVKRL